MCVGANVYSFSLARIGDNTYIYCQDKHKYKELKLAQPVTML